MPDAGRLPGIDTCAHLLAVPETGALPSWETLRGCPVCLRRWRIAEARLRGWTPLPAGEALRLLDTLAVEAADGRDHRDEPTYRGFYAFLATAPEAEADFAAACSVAFAAASGSVPSAPGDFGWRAIFADLPVGPPATPVAIARVWQWREAGTAFAGEMRTFIRGEAPPPFAIAPPDLRGGGRWVREGNAAPPLQRQILGPVLLTATAGERQGEIVLILRLRAMAGAEAVQVRLVPGADPANPAQVISLSEEQPERAMAFRRADYRDFQIEIDTPW